jgi:hypothetical protein
MKRSHSTLSGRFLASDWIWLGATSLLCCIASLCIFSLLENSGAFPYWAGGTALSLAIFSVGGVFIAWINSQNSGQSALANRTSKVIFRPRKALPVFVLCFPVILTLYILVNYTFDREGILSSGNISISIFLSFFTAFNATASKRN